MVRPTAHWGFSYLWEEVDVGFGSALLLSALDKQDTLWVSFRCFCCQLCVWVFPALSSDFLSGSPSLSAKRSGRFGRQSAVPSFSRPAFSYPGWWRPGRFSLLRGCRRGARTCMYLRLGSCVAISSVAVGVHPLLYHVASCCSKARGQQLEFVCIILEPPYVFSATCQLQPV